MRISTGVIEKYNTVIVFDLMIKQRSKSGNIEVTEDQFHRRRSLQSVHNHGT